MLGQDLAPGAVNFPDTAYLQYTSGSTRLPAGVMISHRNLVANFEQIMSDYFMEVGGVAPPDTTIVSWLPFYHDMGLVSGSLRTHPGWISHCADESGCRSSSDRLGGCNCWRKIATHFRRRRTSLMNWRHGKTSDEDMAGLDLGNVLATLSGSERVHPATLRRFNERFARFNLPQTAIRPSYGLAEATVYALARTPAQPPHVVNFASDKLSNGLVERCESGTGTPLVSYGVQRSPMIRIVDPDTRIECPQGTAGEIWIHGDNVAMGYWQKSARD